MIDQDPNGAGSRPPDPLDEALEDTFPASDPVALGHSDRAGTPPDHATTSPPSDPTGNVIDNAAQSRFELAIGEARAVAYYRREGDRLTLTHTEVPQELSGRGIGSKLAHGAFEALRGKGLRVVAQCPFMASYAKRHPEYMSLLDG